MPWRGMASLVPRVLCSGTQTLKMCMWREPGIFSLVRKVVERPLLHVGVPKTQNRIKSEGSGQLTPCI